MTRTAKASPGAVLVRYLPAIAVVVALVVAGALTGSDAETTSRPEPVERGALPLTFDEAAAQGEQVEWGPQCDTTTGQVAVPLWYSPPCVEPWHGR